MLTDALIAAFGTHYSEKGRRLALSFANVVLTEDDFKAAREILPSDAPWELILEFAGRQRAMLMRLNCEFTQSPYETDFNIEN